MSVSCGGFQCRSSRRDIIGCIIGLEMVEVFPFFSLFGGCAFHKNSLVCAILTGLTNLSTKYFFILLHRNQELFVYLHIHFSCRDSFVSNLARPIDFTKRKTTKKKNERENKKIFVLDFPSTLYPIIGCVGFVTPHASFCGKDVECNLICLLALISSLPFAYDKKQAEQKQTNIQT